MAKYKINVQIEFVECDDTAKNEINRTSNVCLSLVINEQDAINIDHCEKSVLQTAYPALREAVAQHLSEMSKKKLKNDPRRVEKL
jgi:hypothetical protein